MTVKLPLTVKNSNRLQQQTERLVSAFYKCLQLGLESRQIRSRSTWGCFHKVTEQLRTVFSVLR